MSVTLSQEQIALLAARVAVGLGGRSTLSRVQDETVVSAGRALVAANKSRKSAVADRDDTVHADFLSARNEFFQALSGAREAFASRHENGGIQRFRDAMALLAVKSRVPVPARAMSTRVSSAILNYARKNWYGFSTAAPLGWDQGFNPDLGVMGMATVSDHHGVWETPEDAVQAAVLHLLESGEATSAGVPIGSIFRAVKFAAVRMSRGRRAYDYATDKGVAEYDWTRDEDSVFGDADLWRDSIAAWASHRDYAESLAAHRAAIAAHRQNIASLMDDASAALFQLVSAGMNAFQIAQLTGYTRNDGTVGPEQVETMIRHAAKSSSYASRFLPAIPEWTHDDEPNESINDVVVRRAEGMRAVQVRHVNR
jgi:hypothetical protein